VSRLKANTKQNKKSQNATRLVYAETVGPTTGVGLLSKIASIFSIISGVNFGITSIALRLSMTCSGFDAPRMTVDVFGFLASHARARWVTVQLSSVRCEINQLIQLSNKDENGTYHPQPTS
jgi:hypothetical protein